MTTPQIDSNKFRTLILQFGGYLELERPGPGGTWEGHAELAGVSASAIGASALDAEQNAVTATAAAIQAKLGDLQNAWTAIITP